MNYCGKKKGELVGLIALVGMLLLLPARRVYAGGENLVPNGGFEQVGEKGELPGWSFGKESGTPAALAVISAGPHSGERAVKISLNAEGISHLRSRSFPVEAGRPYLVSFWCGAEGFHPGGVSFNCRVYYYSAVGKPLGENLMVFGKRTLDTPPKPWQLCEMVVNAPVRATTARVGIMIQFRQQSGSLYLDDVCVRDFMALCGKVPEKLEPKYTYKKFNTYAPLQVVDDPDAAYFPRAVHVPKGTGPVHLAEGPIGDGSIPPGLYAASFRLKTNAPPDGFVGSPVILAPGVGNWAVSVRTLSGRDFAARNVYEEFTIYFATPPDGRVKYIMRCSEGGPTGGGVWFDCIKVTPLRVFGSKEEADAIYRAE